MLNLNTSQNNNLQLVSTFIKKKTYKTTKIIKLFQANEKKTRQIMLLNINLIIHISQINK